MKRIRDVVTRGWWRESRGAKRDEEESDRKEKKRERQTESPTTTTTTTTTKQSPLLSALPCLFVPRGILVAQPCTYHLIKRAPQYRALSWPTVRGGAERRERSANREIARRVAARSCETARERGARPASKLSRTVLRFASLRLASFPSRETARCAVMRNVRVRIVLDFRVSSRHRDIDTLNRPNRKNRKNRGGVALRV